LPGKLLLIILVFIQDFTELWFMRSKLFVEKQERMRTDSERWVRVLPDNGEGYRLYDVLRESYLGRILFDSGDNWIYDGVILSVDEQEDVAGFITGNEKEMNELIRNL
jgi:hypothetical protein